MNITFLIGNGFDVNLGLKTRYTDFYPYYLGKKHGDLLFNAIADNYENWADLEVFLGQFLNQITPDDIDAFLDSKGVLENDLAEYLKAEEQCVSISEKATCTDFSQKIAGFYKEFSSKDQSEFTSWQKTISSVIRYHFISFNYTDALDKIVNQAKKQTFPGTHTCSSTRYQDELGNILHIHGTLINNLILGINDVTQIANPTLHDKKRLTDYIVKPSVNDSLGEQQTETAKRIIDNSDYVCVYGMSLGDTDRLWWEYLLQWLCGKSSRRLVLYIYGNQPTNPSGQQKLRQINKWKNTFFRKANTTNDIIEKTRSQIIVLIGSGIFDLPDVRLEVSRNKQRGMEPVEI